MPSLPFPARKLLLALLTFLASNAFAQPKVTSFSPASGPAGTTVTITGTGFNPSATGNTVFFGAVRAAVSAGSGTGLTVVVPAGATYEPISVLNTATALTGYASNPFVITFANPAGTGIPPGFFQPKVNFATDYAPSYVAIGDIDGDGKSDMIVAAFTGVFVLRNVSTAGSFTATSFAERVTLPGGSIIGTILVKDIDGDGKPDIVGTSGFYNTVIIWRNTSTPGSITSASFAAPVTFTAGSGQSSGDNALAIGDLDGDGKPDLAVTNQNFNIVSVFRNMSSPGTVSTSTFAPRVDFATDNTPTAVAIGDLDGDGRPDLVAAVRQNSSFNGPRALSVLRNTALAGSISAASFAAHVEFAAGNGRGSLAIGDIDGDGKPDLAALSNSDAVISVLRNTSIAGSINAASFAAKVDFASSGSVLAIGDVDGNGKPDIVTSGSSLISVLRNTAAAGSIDASSFAAKADFPAADAGTGLALGDLDGDGITDVAVANNSAFSVSVLRANAASFTAVPRIISIVPAAAPAGATVTINGSGFDANPAANTVFFGAVKAAVTSSTSTSLTVVVPAGATYQPLSVLNGATGLTGYSSVPFNITFSNPYGTGIPYNFYRPRVQFPTGNLPYSVAVGDLDGDGKPDMVVANAAANTISIRRNAAASSLGVASFELKIDIPVGSDPRSVAIGDLDANGKPDIVVANSGSGSVTVLRNSSSPGNLTAASFDQRESFPTGAQPFSVVIADIDLDGKPDLVTANLSAGTVSVLHNTGVNGAIFPTSFNTRTDFPAGASPRFVAVSDLDGDGKADIAAVNEQSGTVSVLRNTAANNVIDASSFAVPQGFATGAKPNWVGASDINADGRPDLVVVNYGSNTVSVLRNVQTSGSGITPGTFAAKVDFATGPQPFSAVAGDLDGDGRPDIAVVNTASTNLSVLRNISASSDITGATFAPKTDFAAGGYPISITLGDLDGNGIPEIISADAATNSVSGFAINSPQPIAIYSFSPASGPVGTTVTINGDGFDPTYSLNQVFFGAVKAQVTGGNATTLQVKVPAGATYEPVTVSRNVVELAASSSRPFVTTFANPFGSGIPANFYRPRIDFPLLGAFNYDVAFGDVNFDGKPDLISVNEQANTLSLMRNITPAGSLTPSSFAAPVNFATAGRPRAVAFIDVDGYSYTDILVLSPASYTLSVFKNFYSLGTIDQTTLYPRVDFPTGGYASSFAVGDLDGDGRPEVVLTNPYAGTVTVLRNQSYHAGVPVVSFAVGVTFPAGAFPRSVAVGDMNGDGKPDIVVANEQGNTVSVLLNRSVYGIINSVSFAPQVEFPVGSNPNSIALGDIDNDSQLDIVTANYASSTVSVLRNTYGNALSAVTFAPKVDFATGTNPYSVTLGDADGDGRVDLITANANANTVSVLRNTAAQGTITAASFAPKADFSTSGYPIGLAFGDLDGDGIPEIGAANAADGAVSVLKVNSPQAAPAAAPAGGTPGEVPLKAGAHVYPNPTKGEFTLEMLNVTAQGATLELLNASGTAIERRTLNTGGKAASLTLRLSLRGQPAGVYYVKVTGINGVQVMKVVVQR